MQVSAGDFNIVQFKSLIEQSPTEGNGWRLKYEGQVDGDHQDSTMKVYKKYFEDSSDPIDRIDTVLKGVDLDNLALILNPFRTDYVNIGIPKISIFGRKQ